VRLRIDLKDVKKHQSTNPILTDSNRKGKTFTSEREAKGVDVRSAGS
jgi:hypothetical protein